MATIKARIKQSILNTFDTATSINNRDTAAESRDKIADAIADAVITEVKAATITITGTAGPYPIIITSIIIT